MGGAGDPKDQRVQCWAGPGASPGKMGWGGLGKTWTPPMPLRLPQSTSVLARKPIGYLSHHPRLWAGVWGGRGSGARTPLHHFLRMGHYPGRGYLSSLPRRGNPQPRPSAPRLGRDPPEGGSRELPLPSAPTDTPRSESHACPCI